MTKQEVCDGLLVVPQAQFVFLELTTNSIPAEIGSPVIFVRTSFFLLEAS
jgi:hypothetical protein